MTTAYPADGPRRQGWEHRTLAVLAHPANLALAGVAAFLLALPVVTWLAASVAAGRALHGWLLHDDDRVFTGTFREFAATWRRTLPASVATTAVVAVLVVNVLFLGRQDTPVAFVLGMATVPFAVAGMLVVAFFPVAAALQRDAGTRDWARGAVALAAARPMRALLLAAVVAAFWLTCVLLPTIAPFFGLSLPVWLALVTAGVSRTEER